MRLVGIFTGLWGIAMIFVGIIGGSTFSALGGLAFCLFGLGVLSSVEEELEEMRKVADIGLKLYSSNQKPVDVQAVAEILKMPPSKVYNLLLKAKEKRLLPPGAVR